MAGEHRYDERGEEARRVRMVEKGRERRENECRDLKESHHCFLALRRHRSNTMVGYPVVPLLEEPRKRGASANRMAGQTVLSIETWRCSNSRQVVP